MSYGNNKGEILNIQKLTRKYGLKIVENKDSLRIENRFHWSNSGFSVLLLIIMIGGILAALYHCMTIEEPYFIEQIGKFLLPLVLFIPVYFLMNTINYFVAFDIFEIKIYRPIGTKTIPYNHQHQIVVRQNTYTGSGKYNSSTYLEVEVILKMKNTETSLFYFSELETNAHEIVQLAKQLAGLIRRKMLSFNGNIQTK